MPDELAVCPTIFNSKLEGACESVYLYQVKQFKHYYH